KGAYGPTLTIGPKIQMIRDSNTIPISVHSQRDVRIDQKKRSKNILQPLLDQDLDTPVQCRSVTGAVVGNRFGRSPALGTYTVAGHAVLHQKIGDGLRAGFRQPLVVRKRIAALQGDTVG